MSPSEFDCEVAPFNHDELAERCLGQLDLVERILAKFQTHFEGDLTEMEAALAAEDATTVHRLAHRLKGSSANVAAPRLREKAEGIEQLAADQCLAEIPARFVELQNEWSLFRNFLASRDEPTGNTV
jgi:HPt (histidine-containing phosphotransfer) domain-containing protein